MSFILGLLMSLQLSSAPAPIPYAEVGPKLVETDIVLHLKSPLISGNSVKLGYEIPYPGYIEFHLFGPDGEKIWQSFGVRDKGEHYQAIRRDKLETGATYKFEFRYKGKPYPGKFTNN